jgi:virulence factor Mce-like protein
MRRVIYGGALLIVIGAFMAVTLGASSSGTAAGTYKIEFDNAFGLVTGADFRVAGVNAGSITGIDLNQKDLHAVVTVQVTQAGFGQFHADATCQTRPQSLIGEYFVECNPGSRASPVLKPGSTIPVTHTQATIPADLLADIMRLPYRQRLSLIINELGAGVAGRSADIQAALKRAVPAIDQTDRVLNLLSRDSATIEDLTHNANTVITALANNSKNVTRFITEANNAATDTATQQQNLRLTLQNLPPFLEQLQPALAKLGAATDANTPVLENLNAAAPQFARLLRDLPAFSQSALPAIRSLGQASVTGKAAVIAARPTIHHLNQFSTHTPELAQNLAIVLHDLDNRGRAVEKDSRSPGGRGFTGLEAVLQYAFNQVLAVDYFGPFGHTLALDVTTSPMCSPYATPGSIALALKAYGSAYRKCYSWLGPNQPGVNETDPTDPSAPVPDPGGAPPGLPGPRTNASRLTVADVARANDQARQVQAHTLTAGTTTPTTASTGTTPASPNASTTTSSTQAVPTKPPVNLGNTINSLLGLFGGSGSGASKAGSRKTGSRKSGSTTGTTGTSSTQSSTTPTSTTPPANQAQQLLSYLLSP